MKTTITMTVVTATTSAIFILMYQLGLIQTKTTLMALPPATQVQAAPVIPTPAPLIEFTTQAIALSNPKISDARKTVIARLLTDIAERTFERREHQEFWIALVGVESRYQSTAKSPVGAVGLGQLMPQYRDDFARTCVLGSIEATDLQDDYTNATVSACVFDHLIKAHNSVTLAQVAYNAGGNSYSMKQAKQGSSPVLETAAYVTKIGVKRDQTKQQVKKENSK